MFKKKVRLSQKTIIYELMPPPKDLQKSDIESSISTFARITRRFPIDGINIPEVREETRNGKRKQFEIIKVEPKVIAKYLKIHSDIDIIINRPTVYTPWNEQEIWFKKVYSEGIRNIILVGGESSRVKYPGPSVLETSVKLKKILPDIFLGGIIIPTRKNEADRVFKKSEAGIEFFTSQILYDSYFAKKFLKEYFYLCNRNKVLPKMIFLSFTPVSTPKDIELLQWLGVDIPKKTVSYLQKGWFGMGWRSLDLCLDIFEDILEYTSKNKINVPLGLNIEHVNRHNFESSFILLERISRLYLGKSKTNEVFRYL